jgi:hypothetical protein
MIFEFWIDPNDQSRLEEYLLAATELRALVPAIDGFAGIERVPERHPAGEVRGHWLLP